ncbi:MAG TPA: penicillin-binding transpeptidase domain-containing protein [Solirubrobacteraceae bacterium]|nr:penicillin-binding transpeptidase domain-containing protein [Solirubrobacteraceae bacterium]
MFSSAPPRRSVGWLEPGRRRRRHAPPARPLLVLLALAVLVGGGVAAARWWTGRDDARRAAATAFASAWARRDARAMWDRLTAAAQRAHPYRRVAARDRAAARAATVTAVRTGRPGALRGGRVAVPVTVRTRLFGALRGTVVLPVAGDGGGAGVVWTAALRLPGLRPGERVRRRVGARPRRAALLAADGGRLDRDAEGAAIAGRPPSGSDRGSGLERAFDARLAGTPEAQLRFGRRVVARVPQRRGRPVRTTISLRLQRAALAALGGRLGGVAVLRPRTGDVLALAGLASSAPQPPGSTFKIITLSAALQARIARPSSTYPVRTHAVLSGVPLRNASDESCGGTLVTAFAVSCNSVFAPLGARLGARRLVGAAERFGFNERPRIPGARASTIPAPKELRDDLAVGASAIGQDRDLATPLGMASVGATIATRGVRATPRIARVQPVRRRRVVRTSVARQVRSMMIGVVRGGTGVAAALPGVTVAGKTGTAELRPTAGGPPDPRNTDAWFVAFAPATAPRIAVGVMLVGAGAGGASAAPVARQVLQSALG